MELIFFFMRYSLRYLGVTIAVGVVSGVSATLLMAVISSRLSGPPTQWNSIGCFSILVGVVLLTNFGSRVTMSHLSQWTLFNLRLTLARLIVLSPLRTIENAGSHKVLVALTNDINDIAWVLQAIPITFVDATVLLAAFAYMIWLNWRMFIISLISVVLAVVTSKISEFKAAKTYAKAREYWDEMIGDFRLNYGWTERTQIASSAARSIFWGPLTNDLTCYRRLRFEGDCLFAWARAWGIVMFLTLLGIVLYTLPTLARYKPGTVFGYVISLMYLKAPLDRLQDNIPIYREGKQAMDHICNLGLSREQIGNVMAAVGKQMRMKKTPETDSKTSERPPKTSFQQVELMDVTHKYYREQGEREFELGGLNFTITAGEMIFLVGRHLRISRVIVSPCGAGVSLD